MLMLAPQLNIARDEYRQAYLRKWAETAQRSASGKPMDVLICPASSVQGTPHDVKPWWGYSAQWNLLDYPAGIVPAGEVREDDGYPDGYQPANELDRENMELCKSRTFPAHTPRSATIARLLRDSDRIQTSRAPIWGCWWLSRWLGRGTRMRGSWAQ